jgi:hypothetical protein
LNSTVTDSTRWLTQLLTNTEVRRATAPLSATGRRSVIFAITLARAGKFLVKLEANQVC